MKETYKLVSAEQLTALSDALKGVVTILDAMTAEAGDLTLPRPNGAAARPNPRAEYVDTDKAVFAVPARNQRYEISRGGTTYLDVINKEFSHLDEFSLDEIWPALEAMIETDAARPRDSVRVALDRSDEFQRPDKTESRWRRVGAASLVQVKATQDSRPDSDLFKKEGG